MGAAKVFFTPMSVNDTEPEIETKLETLCDQIHMENYINHKELVAIKMHFGERGNTTHIAPFMVRPIVNKVKKAGGAPFLTDTNVLYKSDRSNAVTHIQLAHDHGFTIPGIGAPIIITDGLVGDSEIEVEIPGIIYQKVAIAREIITANALISLSHVTGHMASGLGATIKNLGMGLASRKGKMRQHSTMKPEISTEKCTQCGLCIAWCPENTIEMHEHAAFIISENCIGCGECLAVCRYTAVRYNWKTAGDELQRRMAEHALGAVVKHKNRCLFFNFAINMTKDCDCMSEKQTPCMPDLGVLASADPVAVDKATLDLIEQKNGVRLKNVAYPKVNEMEQLHHGQRIGLGTMRYELIL